MGNRRKKSYPTKKASCQGRLSVLYGRDLFERSVKIAASRYKPHGFPECVLYYNGPRVFLLGGVQLSWEATRFLARYCGFTRVFRWVSAVWSPESFLITIFFQEIRVFFCHLFPIQFWQDAIAATGRWRGMHTSPNSGNG